MPTEEACSSWGTAAVPGELPQFLGNCPALQEFLRSLQRSLQGLKASRACSKTSKSFFGPFTASKTS